MSYSNTSNRRAASNGNPVSLFPFLAVLLCTMGTLIVVLMLIARQAQLSSEVEVAVQTEEKQEPAKPELIPAPAMEAKPASEPAPAPKTVEDLEKQEKQLAERLEETHQLLDIEQWKLEQMQAERTEKAKQLQDSRIAMGVSQEERDKLLAELNRMRQALAEQKNGDAEQETPEALQKQLAENEAKIQKLQRELEAAENTAKQRDGSYAILPHANVNGTRRYPIYIECRKDGAWLMPENIQLRARDFEGVLSMGNPLEAALMAKREYLRQNGVFQETPGNEQEPYPLIVVRPDGIVYLYMVRSALQSWKTEYGYELVQDDWKLAYPPNDSSLAQRMTQAVAQARVRQEEIAAMVPTLSELSNGTSSGNVAPAYRPTSQGPQAMNVAQDSRLARTLRNSNREQQRLAATAGGSPEAQEAAAKGAFGTNSGAETAALPNGQRGNSGMAAQAGGGFSAEGTKTGAGGSQGSNVAGAERSTAQGSMPDVSQWRVASNGEAGSDGGAGSSDGELGADGLAASDGSDASGTSVASGTPSASGTSAASAAGQGANASSFNQYSTQRSIADVEGMNWALDQYRPSMTSLKRNLKMECRRDAYVLPRVGDVSSEVVIPLDSPSAAVRKLAENIKQRTRTWGEPGTGMYWKPVLMVHVAPGAEKQFQTLKGMLKNSGLEIEEETGN